MRALLIDAKGFEKHVEITEEQAKQRYYRLMWNRRKSYSSQSYFHPSKLTETVTVVATDFEVVGSYHTVSGAVVVFEEMAK